MRLPVRCSSRAADLFESLGDRDAASRSLVGLSARALSQTTVSTRRWRSHRRALAGSRGRDSLRRRLRSPYLSRNLFFHGDPTEALEAADAALMIAEPLPPLARRSTLAFNVVCFVREEQGRFQGRRPRCIGTRVGASALEHDLTIDALRTYNNFANVSLQQDRFAEAVAIAEPGLTLATERGNRRYEEMLTVLIAAAKVAMGEWERAARTDRRRRASLYRPDTARVGSPPRPGQRGTRRHRHSPTNPHPCGRTRRQQ